MGYDNILNDTAPDDPSLLTRKIDAPPEPGVVPDGSTLAGKTALLARSFNGLPLIWLYHATLIVALRRRIDVAENWARFMASWGQHGHWMLKHLNSRWLISACDTIADDHPAPGIRAAATAAAATLTTLRLAETERRARGADLRPMGRNYTNRPLYDGLIWFNIGRGDAVANLEARIARARAEGTLPGRILAELLDRAKRNDTVLRRLADAHDLPATAWAPRAAPRLRVALFNDTSEGAHYGCDAVMASIDQLFGDAGIAIGWRHYVWSHALNDPGTAPAIASHDAIVVNGEGTIHSAGLRARALAGLAPMARAAGKKAWLINATLQGNDEAMVADLAQFDHIWVRESASEAWAQARGLRVTRMADLSFCQHLEPVGQPVQGKGRIVIDSVLPEANLRLYQMAQQEGGPLWTLLHDAEGQMQALRKVPGPESGVPRSRWIDGIAFAPVPRGGPRDLAQFAAFLSRHAAMITGRFHAACLAVLLRLPFHALPSNTWKIEAMLADIGLDPARMLGPDAGLPAVLPFSPAERAAIDRYVARARFEAGAMVERILSGY